MCVCPNRTTSFLADVGDSLQPTFISWPHVRPAVGSALWDHLVFVLFQTLGRSSKAGRKAANRGLNKQFSGESQLKSRKDSSRMKDVMFLGAEQEWFFFNYNIILSKYFVAYKQNVRGNTSRCGACAKAREEVKPTRACGKERKTGSVKSGMGEQKHGLQNKTGSQVQLQNQCI